MYKARALLNEMQENIVKNTCSKSQITLLLPCTFSTFGYSAPRCPNSTWDFCQPRPTANFFCKKSPPSPSWTQCAAVNTVQLLIRVPPQNVFLSCLFRRLACHGNSPWSALFPKTTGWSSDCDALCVENCEWTKWVPGTKKTSFGLLRWAPIVSDTSFDERWIFWNLI